MCVCVNVIGVVVVVVLLYCDVFDVCVCMYVFDYNV